MQGDILLYRSGNGSLMDKAIELVTHSQFVHVEVDTGNGLAIGALQQGIVKHPLTPDATIWKFNEHVKDTSLLANGLQWLNEQVGLEYGFDDIACAAFTALIHGFYVGESNHYDCSDLATRFLIEAGAVVQLGTLAQEPHTVTPAMLARQLGIEQEQVQ